MSAKKLVTVFGATGHQGSAVVEALHESGLFSIRALTRDVNSEKAKKLLSQYKDISIVEADLDKPNTLDSALKDSWGVFLVTDFSAHFEQKEVAQGKNAINSAIKNGVKNFVFSGLEEVRSVIGKPCYHFDYKSEIEQYGFQQVDKLNFTSVRLSFYYENYPAFAITKVGDNQYILNAPMGNKKLWANSVSDTGEIVSTVLQNPEKYKSYALGIAGEYMPQAKYAEILSKHLAPKKFTDGGVTLEKYAQFKFPGVEDLVLMFEYFQTEKMPRDIALSKSLNKNLLGFEEWVIKNKESILKQIQYFTNLV